MAALQVVTGYVPIPKHPRTAEEYGRLGEQVFGPLAGAGVNIRRFMEPVENTWMMRAILEMAHRVGEQGIGHAVADNPTKNTLAYHCVQHQKFEWLLRASQEAPKDIQTFVWIDYGVGHVPGVDAHVVWDFLEKVKRRKGDFAIPGCWEKGQAIINHWFPCWRFCGGVFVVPRKKVKPLFEAVMSTVIEQVDKHAMITWEVNTLARAEQAGLIKPRWYQADHNETMFTGYA